YSVSYFEATKRHKRGVKAGFPRRKRALVPVRFRHGCFELEGRRLRLGVARGAPELWVRLGRGIPYPPQSVRSVTLVTEGGRLYLDVTAEVEAAVHNLDPDRKAGVDLGIIHPFAVVAGDEALLVSGRAVRAEERLHLDDTKARSKKNGRKAPRKGNQASKRWRKYQAAEKKAEGRHRRKVRQAQHE